MDELVDGIASNTGNIEIVDPYGGRRLGFSGEAAAYAYFQKNVGLPAYQERVLEAVANVTSSVLLVGFSVGASAIWSISEHSLLQSNVCAIGFYGSQIRHQVDIDPKIPMDLYFPRHESHFNVADLITQLALKNLVTSSMVPYLHGFMNRKSRNFDAAGFNFFCELIRRRTNGNN